MKSTRIARHCIGLPAPIYSDDYDRRPRSNNKTGELILIPSTAELGSALADIIQDPKHQPRNRIKPPIPTSVSEVTFDRVAREHFGDTNPAPVIKSELNKRPLPTESLIPFQNQIDELLQRMPLLARREKERDLLIASQMPIRQMARLIHVPESTIRHDLEMLDKAAEAELPAAPWTLEKSLSKIGIKTGARPSPTKTVDVAAIASALNRHLEKEFSNFFVYIADALMMIDPKFIGHPGHTVKHVRRLRIPKVLERCRPPRPDLVTADRLAIWLSRWMTAAIIELTPDRKTAKSVLAAMRREYDGIIPDSRQL